MQTRNRSHVCSICLDDGADCSGDQCDAGRHFFHAACLKKWAQTCTECPVCKKHFTAIVTQDGVRSTLHHIGRKERPPPPEEEFPHHLVHPLEHMLHELRESLGASSTARMMIEGPSGEFFVVRYS